MLLKLNRHFGQKVIVQDVGHEGDIYSVQVVQSSYGDVCLKFNAPKSILIHREEVWLIEQLKKLSSNDEFQLSDEEENRYD